MARLIKNSLLHHVQKLSNLSKAWNEISKSRGSKGPSGYSVSDFRDNLPQELRQIKKQLCNGKYRFGKVSAIVGRQEKLSGIKRRPIRVAEIRDRVVQRAITRVIERGLAKKFKLYNPASFAYLKKRKGKPRKSTRDAIVRMLTLYKNQRPIVFEADIEKFFDTVNVNKLLNDMVYPQLKDDTVNELIESALHQEIDDMSTLSIEEKKLFEDSEGGIPQGGGISPLLANIYLSPLDQAMIKRKYELIRYADDFIVVCKDMDEANAAHDLARKIINDLSLKMHPLSAANKGTRIIRFTQQKFEFLGIRFNGKTLYPADGSIFKLKKNIDKVTTFHSKQNLIDVLTGVRNIIDGWLSAYCFTNLKECIGSLDDHIRHRVGYCAYRMNWKQSNRPLSGAQRKFSGVPMLYDRWYFHREKLDNNERNVFLKYWD